jgi:hypothetical protein
MQTRPEKPKARDPKAKPSGQETPARESCEPACESIATRRNRYYTGRYLTAHDFRLEQGYFLNRHRLHNRLLHGWGIVCGLEVRPHPNPNCANHVIVQPGIAIDCCGREIILEEPQVVVVWDPDNPPRHRPRPAPQPEPPAEPHAYAETPEQEGKDEASYDPDKEGYDPKQQAPEPEPPAKPPHRAEEPAYLIYVCYCEKETEFAPALYDDGTCGGDACGSERLEANRICEEACLHVIEWDAANRKAHAGCWPGEERTPQPCRDDCDAGPQPTRTGCLEPDCRCDLCVPLALVRPVSGRRGYGIVEESLDFSGRPELGTPAEYLTHIAGLNWPHGGRVALSELRDPDGMNGQLRITFDRKLLPADPKATGTAVGINESTFAVQVHRKADVQYGLAMLHNDGTPPYLDEDGCTAVFTIDDELLEGYQNLSGALLHVILRCDFVLDCHRRPVDGEHLKGMLPSGDGRGGGTFESWFWITGDGEGHRGGRRRPRQEEAR